MDEDSYSYDYDDDNDTVGDCVDDSICRGHEFVESFKFNYKTDIKAEKYPFAVKVDAMDPKYVGEDLAEALRIQKEVAGKARGINFTITMLDPDGNYVVYLRENQPCMGEMRKYKKRDPEGYSDPLTKEGQSDDYLPGDLFHPFPQGIPQSVSVRLTGATYLLDRLIPFATDPSTSPWRMILKDFELERQQANYYVLTFNDMSVDPTWIVSMCNNLRQMAGMGISEQHIKDFSIEELIVLMFCGTIQSQKYDHDTRSVVKCDPHLTYSGGIRGYYLPSNISLSKFFNGELEVLSGPFNEGHDYNRKRLQDVFETDSSVLDVVAQARIPQGGIKTAIADILSETLRRESGEQLEIAA